MSHRGDLGLTQVRWCKSQQIFLKGQELIWLWLYLHIHQVDGLINTYLRKGSGVTCTIWQTRGQNILTSCFTHNSVPLNSVWNRRTKRTAANSRNMTSAGGALRSVAAPSLRVRLQRTELKRFNWGLKISTRFGCASLQARCSETPGGEIGRWNLHIRVN